MHATNVSVCELGREHHLYERIQALRTFYRSQFDHEPVFFVKVPGRVNIIGEHVDYCGYPVLPMAIDQCMLLAVGCSDGHSELRLRNIERDKFEDFDCDLNEIRIDLAEKGSPEWYKYYLCGVKGIYETFAEQLSGRPVGMSIALSGNIPPAAGLSSSSALVSAAALATAHVLGLPLDRKRLASISATSERYIGTQGGGMDQAIAFLARAGCAQFIEFHPELKATPVQLPAGACFIVANSLAQKNKAASSDFNERVVECRLGSRLIAKRMQLANWRDMSRLAQLQEALNCSLDALAQLAGQHLPKDTYTRDDICRELDISEQDLENAHLTANTMHMVGFKLRQRTLHVLQESMRVAEFRAICEGSHSDLRSCTNGTGGLKLRKLAELMRQSHESLKVMYECSHPDLDRLIAISDASGIGARLTGAGWGGCIVALCDSLETSEQYIRTLKDKYFAQLPVHLLEQHQQNDFADLVFATLPGHGAEIYTLP